MSWRYREPSPAHMPKLMQSVVAIIAIDLLSHFLKTTPITKMVPYPSNHAKMATAQSTIATLSP